MKTLLSFARGNAKLEKTTAIFSLPAGFTCPAAMLCLSRADKLTGKITDGPKTQFRCYAANSENLFPNVRKSRWANFEKLKGKSIAEMATLIEASIPRKNITLVRIHSSGDFFNQDYFDAWLLVASRNPHQTFYAYTKALNFWVSRLKSIPENFKLVASRGGRYDNLIEAYKLRNVTVVFTKGEARKMKLPIDHDDTFAWRENKNFALLLHGTQPKGSQAALAWQQIKTTGGGGYKADYFGKGKVTATKGV
jgi:hypothetical protein